MRCKSCKAAFGNFLLVFACLAIMYSTGCSAEEGKTKLPEAKAVKSAAFKFQHPELGDVTFTGSADQWNQIRENLLPAKFDRNPASWEWMGTIELVKADDKPYRVELYSTSKDPGAFAAGKNYAERVYHRGGNTKELLNTLIEMTAEVEDLQFEKVFLQRRVGRAKGLAIKVMKDAGGFYDTVKLSDRKKIEKLGDSIDVDESVRFREDASVGSTVAADIDLIRKERVYGSIRLRGNEIHFGNDFQFAAELETEDFYRELRRLVGDPLED